jgi:antitoxin component of RelBE/YafQ-DinJ toxin-antitoxin module
MSGMSKDDSLEVRLTAVQKRCAKAHAESMGLTLSAFVRLAVLEKIAIMAKGEAVATEERAECPTS